MDYKEKLKDITNSNKTPFVDIDTFLKYFPELQESEDEKIKKAVVKMLKVPRKEIFEVEGITKEQALAWLEKQGEPTSIPADAVLDSNKDGLIADTIRCKIEKQGENKPADKVEPKFKVGDKIYLKPEYRMPKDDTPIANTVFEIRRIDDKYYRFDRSYIFIEDQDKYELVEQKSAEWEPQTGDTFRKKGTTSPTYHLCDKREDGITFDFVENREVGIAGGEISIFALRQDYELVERPKSIENVVEEELNKALQTEVEQKPLAWSEEDETITSALSQLLKDCELENSWNCVYSNDKEVFFVDIENWLKTFKERVQPQPKQEWSEEDERNLQGIIDEIEVNRDHAPGYDIATYDRFLSWLKSLRPQNTWKPTEEQMEHLSRAFNGGVFKTSLLMELYQDLKKLKG